MTPAYIISAYKRPNLLFRLVEALGAAPIAVHVDLKSDIFPEVEARLGPMANVTLLPRHICHWGLFGHVEASLEGLTWFLTTGCDYAILLTGQCYPIKTQRQIVQDLEDLDGRSILETSAFPKVEWNGWEMGGFRRVDRFYFQLGSKLRSLKPWARKMPLGMHPHGGSGYWCLSRAAAAYLLDTLAANPAIVQFFSKTYVPDETFFQTLLANSPLKAKLVSALLHYTDWSGGGASPAVLTREMLPAAMASGFWFARKFEDPAVLDQADALREARAGAAPPSPWRARQEAV